MDNIVPLPDDASDEQIIAFIEEQWQQADLLDQEAAVRNFWAGYALDLRRRQLKHGEYLPWLKSRGWSDERARLCRLLYLKAKTPEALQGRGFTKALYHFGILKSPQFAHDTEPGSEPDDEAPKDYGHDMPHGSEWLAGAKARYNEVAFSDQRGLWVQQSNSVLLREGETRFRVIAYTHEGRAVLLATAGLPVALIRRSVPVRLLAHPSMLLRPAPMPQPKPQPDTAPTSPTPGPQPETGTSREPAPKSPETTDPAEPERTVTTPKVATGFGEIEISDLLIERQRMLDEAALKEWNAARAQPWEEEYLLVLIDLGLLTIEDGTVMYLGDEPKPHRLIDTLADHLTPIFADRWEADVEDVYVALYGLVAPKSNTNPQAPRHSKAAGMAR